MSQRSDEDVPPISSALLDLTDLPVLGKRSRSEKVSEQSRSVADLEALRRLANTAQRSGASNLSALGISSGRPVASTYGMSSKEVSRREALGLPGPGLFQGAPDTPGALSSTPAAIPQLGQQLVQTEIEARPTGTDERSMGRSVIRSNKTIKEVNTLNASTRLREETADTINNNFFTNTFQVVPDSRNRIIELMMPDLLDFNIQCLFWPAPVISYLVRTKEYMFVTSSSVLGFLGKKQLERSVYSGMPTPKSIVEQNVKTTERAYDFWKRVSTSIHDSDITDKEARFGSYTTTFFDSDMNNIFTLLKTKFPDSECDRLNVSRRFRRTVGSLEDVISLGTELANQYFFSTKIIHGPMFQLRDVTNVDTRNSSQVTFVNQAYLDAFARLSACFEVFQKKELAVNDIRIETLAQRFEVVPGQDFEGMIGPLDFVFTNFGFSYSRDQNEATTNKILTILKEKQDYVSRDSQATPVQRSGREAYKNDLDILYTDFFRTLPAERRIHGLYLNDIYQFLKIFVQWLEMQKGTHIQHFTVTGDQPYSKKDTAVIRIKNFMEELVKRMPTILSDPKCGVESNVSFDIATYVKRQFKKFRTPSKKTESQEGILKRGRYFFNEKDNDPFCGKTQFATSSEVTVRTPIRTTRPMEHLLDNMIQRIEDAEDAQDFFTSFDDLFVTSKLAGRVRDILPGSQIKAFQTVDIHGDPIVLYTFEARTEKPKKSRRSETDFDEFSDEGMSE